MKCDHCGEEIKSGDVKITTAPDGDTFHNKCYGKYKIQRDKFFNDIVHNDDLYNKWIGTNG